MPIFVIQTDKTGLFVLVDDIRCYPTEETSYKVSEQVFVEISGTKAVIKDKLTANAYSEIWQAASPKPKPKYVHTEKEFVWIDLIEKTIYFVPLTAILMLWSFMFGCLLGWLLIG